MLTKEQKAIAINLAMDIDMGKYDFDDVLADFKKHPCQWDEVLRFWQNCNEMTNTVLNRLYLEKLYRMDNKND